MQASGQREIGRVERRRSVGRASFRLLLALLIVSSLAPGCSAWQAARLYQSGTRALDAGDSQAAIHDLERAATLAPEASEIQNHLGLAHLAAGDEAEARLAFERAVALDCENEAAQHNLDLARSRPHVPGDDPVDRTPSTPADEARRGKEGPAHGQR